MRYTLLIYVDQNIYEKQSPEEMQALSDAYNSFGEQFKDKIKGGEALLPTASATTVRVREGRKLLSQGPVVATKEQCCGHYLLNCRDLDEAVAVAARIPSAKNGAVEVRPIID